MSARREPLVVRPPAGDEFLYGRGRVGNRHAPIPTWMRHDSLNGLTRGDRVRVVGDHYMAGVYRHGYVDHCWRHPEYPENTGVIVRFYAWDLVWTDGEHDPRWEGMPRFEDGGYSFGDLESLEQRGDQPRETKGGAR